MQTHTHTNISTLFEIYRFFENRSKSLSKQSTLLSYTYGRHSLVSKPKYQQRKYWDQGTKATTGSGKLHTVCFNMHCNGNTCIYIYNGCKNLSTYLSYTAEFLQAQELSDPLKPLKMVQLHLPGMFACEKLWQINSGHADTHTQTYLHYLKSINIFLK
jgi:hypothetical protein